MGRERWMLLCIQKQPEWCLCVMFGWEEPYTPISVSTLGAIVRHDLEQCSSLECGYAQLKTSDYLQVGASNPPSGDYAWHPKSLAFDMELYESLRVNKCLWVNTSEWEQGKERAVWDDVSLVSLLCPSTLFTLYPFVQPMSHPSMPSCGHVLPLTPLYSN